MKKILILTLIVSLTLCGLPFSSNAVVEETFAYENKTVTISSEGDELSLEKINAIADFVADDNICEVSTYSILCVFGHKVEYSNAVLTDHNYYTTSPFCRETIYEVETCTRDSCTYMSKTIIDQSRITSCHG